MFEHRKYHWLWFLIGVMIAVVVATLMGCEQPQSTSGVIKEEPPVYCCMALTPSCEACQEGIPEDVWLENTCGIDATDAEYGYWDEIKNEPVWLCKMVIIN